MFSKLNRPNTRISRNMSHKYSKFLMFLWTFNNLSNSVAVSVKVSKLCKTFYCQTCVNDSQLMKLYFPNLLILCDVMYVESTDLEPFTGLLVLTRTYLTCHWSLRKRVATNYKTTARASKVLGRQPRISKCLDCFGSDFSCNASFR